MLPCTKTTFWRFLQQPGPAGFPMQLEVIPPCSLTVGRHLHTRHRKWLGLSISCPFCGKSLEAQSLTTTSNDRPLWLSRTSLKSNSKSMEPKNTELAKKKKVFNTFEYGYFWKFADNCHIFEKKQHLKYLDSADEFFACHCLHLCRRLNIWKNPEVFDLIPIYNRFMIDGHPLPQRCNRHSRWHFPSIEFWQPAWGGNFGQVPQDEGKKHTIQRCCPL